MTSLVAAQLTPICEVGHGPPRQGSWWWRKISDGRSPHAGAGFPNCGFHGTNRAEIGGGVGESLAWEAYFVTTAAIGAGGAMLSVAILVLSSVHCRSTSTAWCCGTWITSRSMAKR